MKEASTMPRARTYHKNLAPRHLALAQSTEQFGGTGEKKSCHPQGLANQRSHFDPKMIMPSSKSSKTLAFTKDSGVLEDVTIQYIDGYTRALKLPLENQDAAASFVPDVPNTESVQEVSLPKCSDTDTLTQNPPCRNPEEGASSSQLNRGTFKAFGIEAFPTRAYFNEICYDFVSCRRWCPHGASCFRIHPLDKRAHLAAVVKESVAYSRMRAKAKLERENPDMKQTPKSVSSTHSANSVHDLVPPPIIPSPPIRVKLPSVLILPPPTLVEPSSKNPIAHLEVPSLSGTQESRSAHNHENCNESVEQWDTTDSTSGVDLSKSDGDHSELPLKEKVDGATWNPWKDMPPRWHTTGHEESSNEEESWSDSDDTSLSGHQPTSRYSSRSTQTTMSNDGSEESSTLRPHSPPLHPRTTAQPMQIRHRKPKTDEVCRNWRRNQCNRGFSCPFIHEDLEYDDDSTHESIAKPVPEILMSRTLHQHIRPTFGSGFCVTTVSTGFESPSISISGISDVAEDEIRESLKPFGQVTEIRRTGNTSIKAFFSNTSEAFAALTSLHGKTFLGCKPTVKPGEVNSNRLVFRGNAVRFEWNAPCRDVYMGYASRMLADMAIEDAKVKPYEDFMTVANIHVGIPAVGAVTVRFRYLPIDVDQDKMKTFGPHQGMVTAKPNLNCTPQSMIRGFRNALISHSSAQKVLIDIRHPPYRDGKMTAWVVFANSSDAQTAAKAMNGLRPAGMAGAKVSAFYMKSISFSLKREKYEKVESDIRSLQTKLVQENKGYWLNILERGLLISIRISGDDTKGLGRLKAEFERILNGEQLYDEGKVVWDPFFVRQSGSEYLQGLERDHAGVTIEVMRLRNIIRLWGVAEKRALVRKRIIDIVKKRRAASKYIIRLRPNVAIAFGKDERDGFPALEALLGAGNVILDQWENHLVVIGSLDAYTAANDAVSSFSQRFQLPNQNWGGGTCPACFTAASLPTKLPCGHSWCRSCLQRYLKVAMEHDASFPVVCHGINKPCRAAIPLLIARDVLSTEDFEMVFKSAFSAHVHSHPDEFHYCPTPDCHQIYRSTPEGIVMQCPECLTQICTHCHSEAHEGLTCEEVRDGDDLFRQWALEHSIKQCPKCKVAIEKIEGCNHMTCAMCHTHICWVCLQTFENGLVIYGHMQSEHGGSGI